MRSFQHLEIQFKNDSLNAQGVLLQRKPVRCV
jgi:hypothetical protein